MLWFVVSPFFIFFCFDVVHVNDFHSRTHKKNPLFVDNRADIIVLDRLYYCNSSANRDVDSQSN